jgi:hypothetical protein
MFLNSIARPEHHLERRGAPGPAIPTPLLPFQRPEPRVAWSAMQQRCIGDDRLVCAGVTARADQVKKVRTKDEYVSYFPF